MAKKIIDVEKLLELLRNAVEDYGPDWVDPYAANEFSACKNTYRWEGETRHCIFGHVAKQLGLNIPAGSDQAGDSARAVMDMLFNELGYDFTDSAKMFAVTAQNLQDRGESWGFIIEQAERVAGGQSEHR